MNYLINALSDYKFPHAKEFHDFLKHKKLKEDSIHDYSETVNDFFNYLNHFNESYIYSGDISSIITNDVDQYMSMVYNERNCTDTTYNKIHTHLTMYFKYLFEFGINSNLPTYFIKRKKLSYKKYIDSDWLDLLEEIVSNQSVHMFTKMFLILISKGYSPKEILRPGFFNEYKKIDFNDYQTFKNDFDDFIEKYQTIQGTEDIFLKKSYSKSPNLTHRSLRKYLYPDSQILGISLVPSKLYQSYVISFIQKNNDKSVGTLAKMLNIEVESVMYYINLVNK